MTRHLTFFACLVALSGCRAPTQVKLELSTDADCADVVATTITTGQLSQLDGRPPTTESASCASPKGRIGSLVVIPQSENDADFAVRVVTGFYKTPEQCVEDGYRGGCIVARRALRFIPNTSIDLPIVMEAACIDVPCEATETCRRGTCVSALLDDPLACSDPAGCEGGAAGAAGAEAGAPGSSGSSNLGGSGGGAAAGAGGTSSMSTAGAGGNAADAVGGAGGAGDPPLDPVHRIEVTTADDVLDGNVGSLAALVDEPGLDASVSLREALLAANATPNDVEADRIDFAIPGSGPYTIQVTGSALPAAIDPVVLDATSQPGYAGEPLIELLGDALSSGHGLSLLAGSDGSTIHGFAIGGFPESGIEVDSSGEHWIAGNYVGVRLDGTTRSANTTALHLRESADNLIGGELFGDTVGRNVLSGSREDGLLLEGGQTQGNVISGNLIGLNSSGIAARPNFRHGVLLRSGASFNLLGGTDPLRRNVISANAGNGIRLSDATTEGNVVQGNLIGSDSTFSLNDQLGNAWAGIRITGAAHHNVIGGVGTWLGNMIRYNLLAGVELSGAPSPQDNAVLGNSIANNGRLGINLRSDGAVTQNDAGDADAGANDALNFPHPVIASYAGGKVSLDYVLDVPAGDYRIEFFTSGAPDPSGYGPGEQLAHFELLTHTGNGTMALQTSFACAQSAIITATTTVLDASGGFGATSEFSLAVPTTYTGFTPF